MGYLLSVQFRVDSLAVAFVLVQIFVGIDVRQGNRENLPPRVRQRNRRTIFPGHGHQFGQGLVGPDQIKEAVAFKRQLNFPSCQMAARSAANP